MPARGTRPTTDRVRESLFNVLAARMDFSGLAVLDLYAGSGALGLEALSRGASTALFVESDQRAARVIMDNVAALKLRGATVRRGAVGPTLAGGPMGAAQPMDLVFADPPYDVANSEVEAVLAALAGNGWVAPGAVAVIERPAARPTLAWPAGWEVWRDRRYGDTRLELACYGQRP